MARTLGLGALLLAVLGTAAYGGSDGNFVAPDFSLGVGYANIGIGGSDSELDSKGAWRFDSQFGISPLANVPQLRLSGAFGVTMVLDSSQLVIVSDGGLTVAGSSNMPLIVFEPEARLSWRQSLNDAGSVYLEPGVGFGGAFANLSIDGDDTSTGEDYDESDSTVFTRAFLNLGFWVTGGIGGLQVSYMRGGDLFLAENAQGELDEFYIGVFGALQF